MKRWTLVVVALSAIRCIPPQQRPPDTPLTTNTQEDPDALCAGAERVFLRHAIHLRTDTCATEARSLVTEFVSFQNLKINRGDTRSHKSFSVIISRNTVEIGATCAALHEGKMSEPGDCTRYPESAQDPTAVTKDRLLQEILAEARAVAGARRVREQTATPAPAVTPASGTGCSKDTDCKGSRICIKGECADPPGPPSTQP